jgi:hypothetical protein
MRLTSKTYLACVLLLAACDMGMINLGDLTTGNSSGNDDGGTETSGGNDDGETMTATGGEVETEGEEPVDGSGSACNGAWMLTPAVRDGDWTTANAVVALDDGDFVLGASPDSDDVTRVDADGAPQWTAELGAPGVSFVKDVLLEADGGYIVSI